MAIEILMPKLGLTMREGKITRWFKKEGEAVNKGEVIFELETEKVTFQVEATESGIVGKIIVPEGETVPVATIVGYIIQPGENVEGLPAAAAPSSVKRPTPEVEQLTKEAEPSPINMAEDIKASPLARRIAQEEGIDLGTVRGTGPGGRIVREDVLRAVEEAKSRVSGVQASREVPGATLGDTGDRLVPLTGMRATIARRMSQSFREIPHFWQTVETDTAELNKFRAQLTPIVEKQTGERLTFTDLLIKVVAQSLRENPDVNATFTDKGIVLHHDVNVGLAVAVTAGLVVPVIRQADRKSILEIVTARADVANRAKKNKLLPDDMAGGTFTLTNLGMFGIESGNSIINPPEVAILFVGRTTEKAVVRDGQVVVRPMMSMTLGIDHRALDGVLGARFLTRVKELIEQPIFLLINDRIGPIFQSE